MEDIFDLDEKPEELLGIFISEQKDDLFFSSGWRFDGN